MTAPPRAMCSDKHARQLTPKPCWTSQRKFDRWTAQQQNLITGSVATQSLKLTVARWKDSQHSCSS